MVILNLRAPKIENNQLAEVFRWLKHGFCYNLEILAMVFGVENNQYKIEQH